MEDRNAWVHTKTQVKFKLQPEDTSGEKIAVFREAVQLSWMFVMTGGTVAELLIKAVETVESCSRSLRFKADRCVLMKRKPRRCHWPAHWLIQDSLSAGLPKLCILLFKLFTLEQSLIRGSLGRLAQRDQAGVDARLLEILPVM